MKQQWIGPDKNLSVGDVGFLIDFTNHAKGWTRYELRDTPAYTNQSHQPKLVGWCGTYNDLVTYADGMAKVVRVAKNGRCLVERIEGAELLAALEDLGYPELAGEQAE